MSYIHFTSLWPDFHIRSWRGWGWSWQVGRLSRQWQKFKSIQSYLFFMFDLRSIHPCHFSVAPGGCHSSGDCVAAVAEICKAGLLQHPQGEFKLRKRKCSSYYEPMRCLWARSESFLQTTSASVKCWYFHISEHLLHAISTSTEIKIQHLLNLNVREERKHFAGLFI